jgi:hypothetical protein
MLEQPPHARTHCGFIDCSLAVRLVDVLYPGRGDSSSTCYCGDCHFVPRDQWSSYWIAFGELNHPLGQDVIP